MKKKLLFLSTIILTGNILLTPTVTVYAQGIGGGFGASGQAGFNISGIGAVGLSCLTGGNLSGFVQDIFSGGSDVASSFGSEEAQGLSESVTESGGGFAELNSQLAGTEGATSTISDAAQSVTPVMVFDTAANSKLSATKSNTSKIKQEEKAVNKKETCWDKIARYAALEVMDRLTFSMLKWINSGFEGKPFFVDDPKAFAFDYVKDVIFDFEALFTGNFDLYPFGEQIFKSVIISIQNTFQQNMINSLNAVLAHGTREEFTYDFSVGGWAGYTAFFEPNNNIFGSYIESSNFLGRKLNGVYDSDFINIQRELDRGLGFLSQKKCLATESGFPYIPKNSIEHISTPLTQITSVDQIPDNVLTYMLDNQQGDEEENYDTDGDGEYDSYGMDLSGDDALLIATAEDFRADSNCIQWQTITPGNTIAQQTTKVLNISLDQLQLTDELNENLGLIMDALLNQLVQKGLGSFYTPGGNYNQANNVAWAQVNGLEPGQFQDQNSVPQIINGFIGGGTAGDFVGMIPLQEEYLEKSEQLMNLLIQKRQRIRDLDYCVPGPNPVWQGGTALGMYQFIQNGIFAIELVSGGSVQTTIASNIPILGGILGGFSANSDANFNIIKTYVYYTLILKDMLDVEFPYVEDELEPLVGLDSLAGAGNILEDLDEDNVDIIQNKQQFMLVLDNVFSEYADMIEQRFLNANDFDLGLRGKAEDWFSEIASINQEISQLEADQQVVQQSYQELIEIQELYAPIEYQYIVQFLNNTISASAQGGAVLPGLNSLLAQFLALEQSGQVTYISNNGQPTAYQNLVFELFDSIGYPITPPITDPLYAGILAHFTDILLSSATNEHNEDLTARINEYTIDIGSLENPNSLIGLINSCVTQVLSPNFEGFTERRPYPYPISNDLGLSNLPISETFLSGVTIGTVPNPTNLLLPLQPSGNTTYYIPSTSVQNFESYMTQYGFGSFY